MLRFPGKLPLVAALPAAILAVTVLAVTGTSAAYAQALDCNSIDFEAFAQGEVIGTVAGVPAVDFASGWVAAVDSDAGGTAPIANEPSADTATQIPPSAIIDFDVSIRSVEVWYSARLEAIPVTVQAWDGPGATGTVVASTTLETIGWAGSGADCTGDPTGGYCLWDLGGIDLAEDTIASLSFTPDTPGVFGVFFDDMTFCTGGGGAGEPGFTNTTLEAGVDVVHGFVEGHQEMMPKIINGGVAAGDYDRDGWLDLYIVRGNVGPTMLFRNQGDGTFVDEAAAAGVQISNPEGFEAGPTFADVDGDGWLDLLVGGVLGTEPRLFVNQGDGTFVETTDTAGLLTGRENTFSSTFGDYDKDGDLDLFLAHWTMADDCAAGECGAHLWANDGSGVFSEIDLESMVPGFNNVDFTFAPNWADVDNDGWLDLIVASDFNTSRVMINQGDGTFADTTDEGVITDDNGMGAAVGDYDNDGDLDWYVSSIYNTLSGKTGNRLYGNLGDGTFEDVTETSGVREGFWGWGACFADFDNDGWLDLMHVNGWPFGGNEESDFDVDPARLFISNGDGTFTESSAAWGFDENRMGRGVSCLDYDRDGDIDIFISNNDATTSLWRNDVGADNGSWLNVTLAAQGGNALGVGGRVYATAGGTTQMRELRAGSNFESQDPIEAHFGLGASTSVDELAVIWPDDVVSTHAGIDADRAIEVEEIFGDASEQVLTGGVQQYAHAGCDVCQIEGTMSATTRGMGIPTRVALIHWVVDPGTWAGAVLDIDNDRVVFWQREGGVTAQLVTAPAALSEGVAYDLKVAFDGTDFTVWLDGVELLTTPDAAAQAPSGTSAIFPRNADVTVSNLAVTAVNDR